MGLPVSVKYKIEEGEITTYPLLMLQRLAIILWVLFGFLLLCGILSPMMYMPEDEFDPKRLLSLISLVPLLILYWFGRKRVIFSKSHQMIFQSYGIGRKPIAHFSEIADIQFIDGAKSYRLFFKSDYYGKGIAITPQTSRAKLVTFENHVLPLLNEIIAAHREGENQQKDTLPNLNTLQYYRQKGYIFTVKRRKENTWGIVLLMIAALLGYQGIYKNLDGFTIIMIPFLIVGIIRLSKRCQFNAMQGTLTFYTCFIFKATYSLNQFVNFSVVRNTLNGIYNGTDVKIIFVNPSGKKKVIQLRQFWKTKNIDQFLQETRAIIAQNTEQGERAEWQNEEMVN